MAIGGVHVPTLKPGEQNMARYKPIDRNPWLLPVVPSEQIQPG